MGRQIPLMINAMRHAGAAWHSTCERTEGETIWVSAVERAADAVEDAGEEVAEEVD